jgi:hypothetical protein
MVERQPSKLNVARSSRVARFRSSSNTDPDRRAIPLWGWVLSGRFSPIQS